MKFPPLFEYVIRSFQRLQGIGRKSAERFFFDVLIHWNDEAILSFTQALSDLIQQRVQCSICHSPVVLHTEDGSCLFCCPARINKGIMAVVSSVKDLFAIEATEQFTGSYFVLNGVLSPLDARGIKDETMHHLCDRLQKEEVKEVLLAFDNTPEGEATAYYMRQSITQNQLLQHIVVTELATGVPVGGFFEYLDKATLGRALAKRVRIN